MNNKNIVQQHNRSEASFNSHGTGFLGDLFESKPRERGTKALRLPRTSQTIMRSVLGVRDNDAGISVGSAPSFFSLQPSAISNQRLIKAESWMLTSDCSNKVSTESIPSIMMGSDRRARFGCHCENSRNKDKNLKSGISLRHMTMVYPLNDPSPEPEGQGSTRSLSLFSNLKR